LELRAPHLHRALLLSKPINLSLDGYIPKVSITAGKMFFTKRLTMHYSRKTLYCGDSIPKKKTLGALRNQLTLSGKTKQLSKEVRYLGLILYKRLK
jgi:hypothetical protein